MTGFGWRPQLRTRMLISQLGGLLLLVAVCLGAALQAFHSGAASGDATTTQAIDGAAGVASDPSRQVRRSGLIGERERVEQLTSLRRITYRAFYLVFALGLVGVAMTMWYTSRMVVEPIRSLSGAARGLSEGRWVPVQIRTGDEIEQLATVFNQVAEQIQRTQQELEQKVAVRTTLLETQARELLRQRTELGETNRDLEREKTAMVNVMEDLRETHERLKAAQVQLLQSEKLAGIGQLAAGVAHEINNPTGFVLSNLETIREYGRKLDELLAVYGGMRDRLGARPVPEDAVERLVEAVDQADVPFLLGDLRKAVEESIDGMLRIKRIVQGLRTYARGESNVLVQVDVREELESAVQLAWNELKHKAEVVREYAELPRIWGYGQQLNQVFLNLLVNAAQAIPKYGTVQIRTAVAGDHVVVEVSDTGSGMSEEVQRRIFEPFFTTKPIGQGTGLGLSIAYNIVKAHGGTIDVRSVVGEGTTIAIALPIEQPSAREAHLVKREA